MNQYLTGKRFGTLGCKIDGEMVEITTFRSEQYEPGNRKPKVEFVKNIHQDLSRRDFTINSIAIRLCKGHLRIIDPFCGQEDLEAGVIRAVGNPKQRFKEDPLRILRAVRFACRYNFPIEEVTLKKMKSMAVHLLDISKERWNSEIDKILQTTHIKFGLTYLWEANVFKYIIPEIGMQKGYNQNSKYHKLTLDEHTIKVIEAVRKDTDDLNMLWGALLHDISKPFTRTKNINSGFSNYINHEILGAEMVNRIAKHLNWSKERSESVISLVRNHLNKDCPLREYDNLGKGK